MSASPAPKATPSTSTPSDPSPHPTTQPARGAQKRIRMDTFQFWTITIESVITIIAIVIAGIFAWRNGIIFRHRSPHINIAHDVTHRFISPSYTHLIVTATLHNSSRVKVEFRDGFVVLQKIAPLDDDELTQLYAQSFDDAVSVN